MRSRTVASLIVLPLSVAALAACGDDTVVPPAADATTDPSGPDPSGSDPAATEPSGSGPITIDPVTTDPVATDDPPADTDPTTIATTVPADSAGEDHTGTGFDDPDSEVADDGFVHATGADDVVIEVGYEGGFVPIETVFTQSPNLLITGDGRSIVTGPVIAIHPGPLLPNLLERPISEDGTQRLLALAAELGLLADIEYARNDMIADAPDTVVTITVDDVTYEHRAYALGLDDETDPARQRLAEFVDATTNLAATVGDGELGPEAAYESGQYLVQAMPVDPATLDTDIPPTMVEWPAEAPVRLADAAECAVAPTGAVEALFTDADQLTLFTEGDVTYRVAAIAQLPGRGC